MSNTNALGSRILTQDKTKFKHCT
uniref:Uncharacterized protein n=1 Tax=Rhizophora mucronata TaxID=61149 RepID=A0A2P2N439_RHIMU